MSNRKTPIILVIVALLLCLVPWLSYDYRNMDEDVPGARMYEGPLQESLAKAWGTDKGNHSTKRSSKVLIPQDTGHPEPQIDTTALRHSMTNGR